MSKLGFNAGLALRAALVTEKSAIAASSLAGHGDEKAADQAAVDAMRTDLNAMDIKGRVVIGEGERDEAPMLYIGEEVGRGKGPEIDIALDPLEGTTLTRNDDEVSRARRVGIDKLDQKYDLEGLASGPTIFSATGVTQGSLLDGVKKSGGYVQTHTLIMNSVDKAVQKLRSTRPF